MLDEIQGVPGWEQFARRLMDSEQIDLFLSGSSARLLGREVATSMRGRSMEVLVHPFSFREVLRHHDAEPDRVYGRLPKAARSCTDSLLNTYLREGGFPEAQGLTGRDRASLLQTYVDVAILRDVADAATGHGTATRGMQNRSDRSLCSFAFCGESSPASRLGGENRHALDRLSLSTHS